MISTRRSNASEELWGTDIGSENLRRRIKSRLPHLREAEVASIRKDAADSITLDETDKYGIKSN
jgi:hypothetical protein